MTKKNKSLRYAWFKKHKPAIYEWVESILVALALALFVRTFIVQAYKIPTGSMIPTLMQGDRIFVNRFIYRFKNLARGDVIVFRFPGPEKKDFIKRLIAFPGEKVEISEGKIKINGELVNEPRLLEHYYLNQGAFGQAGEGVIVPEGHFFVLGDNSLSSHDSRFWGYVPKKNLKGKAFCIFWPLDRIGGIR